MNETRLAPAHRWLVTALLVGLVGIQVAILAGCGASTRTKTLQATLVTANTARDTFLAWDSAHQQAIVASATSLDDGKAKLAEYRGKRAKVVEAFEVAYHAIAVATILKDDPTSLANATKALGDLTAILGELTAAGGKP